jgi:RNA polymerase sigma factor (sigma-70 family)
LAAVTSAGRASAVEPLGVAVDSRAESVLFERNASRVYGFCLSRLRRREDAEDALQTTFLHAFRSLRRGVVPLVESAWLLGIARNVCLERWEAAGKRSRVETSWDPGALDRTAPALNERTEDVLDLEDALTRLPAQQRRAVVLRDWRGLSYEEVAAELGVSHSAVETMIFRGRRSLAEYLRDGAQATRRKLGSILHLGWLGSSLRSLFGGGAAGAKVAAAVTVVAVSGTGLAVGETVLRSGEPAPARAEPATSERAQAPAGVQPSIAVPQATAPAASGRHSAVEPASTKRRAPNDSSSPPLSPAGASAAGGPPAPAAASAAATPAPAPDATHGAPGAQPVATTVETVKKSAPKAPLPPVLADPVGTVDGVVASTPVAPVAGAVKDTVAPVVGTVQDTAAPIVDPVVSTVEDVVPPLPPLPAPPPLPAVPSPPPTPPAPPAPPVPPLLP